MIDQEKLAEIRVLMAGGEPTRPSLSDLSEKELRKLRADVDALLPDDKLSSMDMTAELMMQYRKVQDLQNSILDDDAVAPNHKSQVAGQVASTMQHMIKMQTDFYNAERFRAIENLVMQYMKKLPLAAAKEFLDDYEKIGKDQ